MKKQALPVFFMPPKKNLRNFRFFASYWAAGSPIKYNLKKGVASDGT